MKGQDLRVEPAFRLAGLPTTLISLLPASQPADFKLKTCYASKRMDTLSQADGYIKSSIYSPFLYRSSHLGCTYRFAVGYLEDKMQTRWIA